MWKKRNIEELRSRPMNSLPFFVYGTLKKGGRNECVWPDRNAFVQPARLANACLYDFGPYPCLVEGDDIVEGELWTVESSLYEATLRVLDELEGFNQGGANLYVRKVVECNIGSGCVRAFAYFFNQPLTEQFARIPADENGVVRWPYLDGFQSRSGFE